MLFKTGEKYEAFYADAAILAEVSGCEINFRIGADGRRVKHASIDEDEISDVIRRLPANIDKVGIHLGSRG